MKPIIYSYFVENATNSFDPLIANLLRKQYHLQREMETKGGRQHLTALCAVIEKLIALCRSQKEWLVYLESLYCLIRIYDQTGRSTETIPLIMEYLTASKTHMDDIMDKHSHNKEVISQRNCFSLAVVANMFRKFYQFDDDKIDKLLQIFADAANNKELKRYYCQAKIKFDIMNKDQKAAQKTHRELIKLPSNDCYMCSNSMLLDYYVMMDQLDLAVAWIEKILRQDVPGDTLKIYFDCEWLLSSTVYRRLLYAATKHGKIELFLQYKDRYCDIILLDSKSVHPFAFFVLAVNKEYSTLEQMLQEFCENINFISGETPLYQLEQYLCYSAYFYNLHKTEVDFVQLDHLKTPLDVDTENGAYSTAALAKYMQEAADLLGSKFDKSRKQFSYQNLKNTYIQLRDR